MSVTPENHFAPPREVVQPQPSGLLTIGPVARLCRRSTQRIRDLAVELGLPDVRVGGFRVFDSASVARLKTEIDRREREAAR
jgi:hypothetical protein